MNIPIIFNQIWQILQDVFKRYHQSPKTKLQKDMMLAGNFDSSNNLVYSHKTYINELPSYFNPAVFQLNIECRQKTFTI